jgi:hypothetical protein
MRFRYPWTVPFLEWCLERTFRKRDAMIRRGAGEGLRFHCGHGPISFVFGTHKLSLQHAFELLVRPGMTFYVGTFRCELSALALAISPNVRDQYHCNDDHEPLCLVKRQNPDIMATQPSEDLRCLR